MEARKVGREKKKMETVLKDAAIVNEQRVLLDFRLDIYWIYCLFTDHVLSLFTISKRA